MVHASQIIFPIFKRFDKTVTIGFSEGAHLQWCLIYLRACYQHNTNNFHIKNITPPNIYICNFKIIWDPKCSKKINEKFWCSNFVFAYKDNISSWHSHTYKQHVFIDFSNSVRSSELMHIRRLLVLSMHDGWFIGVLYFDSTPRKATK